MKFTVKLTNWNFGDPTSRHIHNDVYIGEIGVNLYTLSQFGINNAIVRMIISRALMATDNIHMKTDHCKWSIYTDTQQEAVLSGRLDCMNEEDYKLATEEYMSRPFVAYVFGTCKHCDAIVYSCGVRQMPTTYTYRGLNKDDLPSFCIDNTRICNGCRI